MFRIYIYLTTLLLALLSITSACDSLDEDTAPASPLLEFDSSGPVVYNTTQGPTVINLLDYTPASTTPYSIQLTTDPAQGKVKLDPQGLLIYEKYKSFTSGTDHIGYTISQNGSAVLSNYVTIRVSADSASVPCSAGAQSDSLTFLVNSQNNLIPVVQNDRVCNKANISVSLFKAPSGQIRLDGTSFLYAPKAGFTGEDSFIYQLCETQNTEAKPICSYAYVSLYIRKELSCSLQANNDGYTLKFLGQDTTYQLNVLANDSWCRAANLQPQLLEQKTNTQVSNEFIYYFLTEDTFVTTDSLRYSLCQDGICKQANVLLSFEK